MNLDTEIRNGYEVSAEMKKIWAIQVDMVKHTLDVCKRHGLKIWADGGTLLGAAREHGYIPWDDDIDLLMLRPDYEKLKALADDEFQSPYFFQCAYTEKKYYRGHAQIRYDGTSMILPIDIFQRFNQGIFIDIFVYDAMPDTLDSEWERKMKRADEISSILFDAAYSRVISKNAFTNIRHKLNAAFGGGLRLFKEYDNLFQSYNWDNCHRMACPCFNREIIKNYTKEIDWYRETVYLPFEDIELPAPVDYALALSTQYGQDYMTPRKAPAMHGSGVLYDTERSYKYHLKELRAMNRKQSIKRLFQKIAGCFHK